MVYAREKKVDKDVMFLLSGVLLVGFYVGCDDNDIQTLENFYNEFTNDDLWSLITPYLGAFSIHLFFNFVCHY